MSAGMSVNALIPRNTQNARAAGVGAFKRFLESEVVDLDYITACLSVDPSGVRFATVMDQFAMHLAFNENAKGTKLKRNTVMSYFRQVKLWLMELFPQSLSVIEAPVLKMGRILEQHCMKREDEGLVKKAAACTKASLRLLMKHIYSNASCATDYQDAALLCLLWYLFGRASDLSLAKKGNMSVCSRGVFFMRIVRVQTSEEQGLTLLTDADFLTCPILGIAGAAAVQAAPCASLFDQFPVHKETESVDIVHEMPLRERLERAALENGAGDAAKAIGASTSKGATGFRAPGVHNFVNRLLDKVASAAGIAEHLSSHSFRRGGAQHANGHAGVSVLWIFDRGGWNLAPTNKAFEYVLNTASEDQRVAKVLSGWSADAVVVPRDLSAFDEGTQSRLQCFSARLFSSCSGFSDKSLVVCDRVREILLVRLVQAYPSLKKESASSPLIQKIESCASQEGIAKEELVSWSLGLIAAAVVADAPSEVAISTVALVEQQAVIIQQLLAYNRDLSTRVQLLEEKHDPSRAPTTRTPARMPPAEALEDRSMRRKSAVTNLSSAWFGWYAGEPRLSLSSDRKKKFDVKHAVAYLKLFLTRGFVLVESASTYRDDVLALGKESEEASLAFLLANGIRTRGFGSVLKHFRAVHRRGELDAIIRAHKALLTVGAIVGPSPKETQNILHTAT